jgi:hypothetical protein
LSSYSSAICFLFYYATNRNYARSEEPTTSKTLLPTYQTTRCHIMEDCNHKGELVLCFVGFEVLTVTKSSIFWDITLCSLLKINWHFGGIYCLHLQGQRKGKQATSMKGGGRLCFPPAFRLVSCLTLYPTRQYSSSLLVTLSYSLKKMRTIQFESHAIYVLFMMCIKWINNAEFMLVHLHISSLKLPNGLQ